MPTPDRQRMDKYICFILQMSHWKFHTFETVCLQHRELQIQLPCKLYFFRAGQSVWLCSELWIQSDTQHRLVCCFECELCTILSINFRRRAPKGRFMLLCQKQFANKRTMQVLENIVVLSVWRMSKQQKAQQSFCSANVTT